MESESDLKREHFEQWNRSVFKQAKLNFKRKGSVYISRGMQTRWKTWCAAWLYRGYFESNKL